MYGIVTVQRVKAKSTGGFVVLPFETSLKLVDGKATIAQAVTDGTGPMYDSAYLFRVQNGYCGQRYGFMAALPDGSTPITTGELPMVDPITGEGIYMDAQEWNELYGDLPDRVISLESSQATQNTQIASLQTGKANTAHTHVIGDVTGLQTVLNAKGNATMRVDTAAGTRVFISDGTTERMVSSSTGWRSLPYSWGTSSFGGARIIREETTVRMLFVSYVKGADPAAPILTLPSGFRPNVAIFNQEIKDRDNMAATNSIDISVAGVVSGYGTLTGGRLQVNLSWPTSDPWPTTLPGTPA